MTLLEMPEEKLIHLGRTYTQKEILFLLSNINNETSLSVRHISNRTNIKFKTVYKELQRLIDWKFVIKDNRYYKLNPEYPELMLETAMKLKGINQPPEWIIVIEKIDEVINMLLKIKSIL